MNRAEHIGELMFRYMRNGLSQREAAELLAWRQEKPDHETFFQQQTDPEYLRRTITAIYAGRENGLKRVLNEHAAPEAFLSRRIMGFKIWKVAAFFLGLIGFLRLLTIDLGPIPKGGGSLEHRARFVDSKGIAQLPDDFRRGFADGYAAAQWKGRDGIPFLAAPYDSNAAPGQVNTLITYEHSRYLMQLPDGSRCWQNANSSVAYPVNFFRDTAKLRIQGEVYVEITPNKSDISPFEVSAGKIHIIAFNGRFNVRSDPKDSVITVTAIEGVLQVRSDRSVYALPPGEQLIISGDRIDWRKAIDIAKVLEWKKD